MRRSCPFILAAIVACGGGAGCANRHDFVQTKPPVAFEGPTDPLDVLLAKINANNALITTVAAAGRFEAWFGKEQQFLNGDVTLIHTKPEKLALWLKKAGAGKLLTAGNNGVHWWLSVLGDIDTTYFGTPHGAASDDPRLPISPELIADVLGVATLNFDMRAEPVPTLRFNPSYDAYMLTWNVSTPDRWVTVREVWYDRASLRPERIWLFDRDGRVTVKAVLSDSRPMGGFPGDASAAPHVARSYDLLFPANQTRLTFSFDDVRPTRGSAPNDKTYRFDPTHAETSKVENLDDAAPAAH